MQFLKLSEGDIQDLSFLLSEVFHDKYSSSSYKEIELLAKRFDVPISKTCREGSLLNKRLYSFLQYINGRPEFIEALSQTVTKTFNWNDIGLKPPKKRHPTIRKIKRILSTYGLSIALKNGAFKIFPVHSSLFREERKFENSWIEKHANESVLSHLRDAKANLGSARYDYVLDDCRKALEALTNCTAGFSDSIAELAKEGVIAQGDKNRKKDAEIIKTLYGYCSTLGSHTNPTGVKPDLEQAVLGLHMTENCIYFLLKRLDLSKSLKTLQHWA